MDEQVKLVGGALVGAAVGTVVAYFFLTSQGRRTFSDLGPALEDLSRVLQDVREALAKVSEVAVEGRRAADDVRAAFQGQGTEPSDPAGSSWH